MIAARRGRGSTCAPWLAALSLWAAALAAACSTSPRRWAGSATVPPPVPVTSVTMMATHPTPGSGVQLRGRLVKLTRWACHMSDPYVGGMPLTFLGSDGSRTTVTTHSATWVGLPAEPPRAPFGNCRQTAAFEVSLPVARSYVAEINHYRFPPITLAELRAEGFRHTFRLPS